MEVMRSGEQSFMPPSANTQAIYPS